MPLNLRTKIAAPVSAAAIAVAMLGGTSLSDAGLEGLHKGGAPYQDIAGIWTDCYGNTKDVDPHRIRSIAECKRLLGGEAERIQTVLLKHLKTRPSDLTLASFISMAYNVGDKAFLNSSVVKRWNRGDSFGACSAMFLWDKVRIHGVLIFSQGVYNRRIVENAACVKGLQNA